MTTKYNAEQYLAAEGKSYAVRSHWKNLTGVSTSGAMWKDWIVGIRQVLQSIPKAALETDPDGVERVASWFHVVCFDNLNSLDAGSIAGEDKRINNKRPKPRTTHEGFLNNA